MSRLDRMGTAFQECFRGHPVSLRLQVEYYPPGTSFSAITPWTCVIKERHINALRRHLGEQGYRHSPGIPETFYGPEGDRYHITRIPEVESWT